MIPEQGPYPGSQDDDNKKQNVGRNDTLQKPGMAQNKVRNGTLNKQKTKECY